MQAEKKTWNEQQKLLRQALKDPQAFPTALQLFLQQHTMLHSAKMSGAGLWSFEDEVWQDLSEAQARRIFPPDGHSIAWNIWHITRSEDVSMNMLVAGGAQVMLGGRWHEHMKVSARDTGNAMPAAEIAELSESIDLEALRDYRLQVGQQTRAVVQRLCATELHQKVTLVRLQRVLSEGAVRPSAENVLAYWSGLTIAGLLLMPPTRHSFLHLNEAMRLRK